MDSRAKIAGHSIHQMLVVFPLGLLITAVAFDLAGLITANPQWYGIAFWLIGAGIIGGLAAAVFGWVDWSAIPSGTRAKTIGLYHGIGNAILLVLFVVSFFLRTGDPLAPSATALACSFVGIGLGLVSGWLGGELVDRLGVGVDTGAHLDSPSSLTGRPASDFAEGYGRMYHRHGRPT
jgi:uncharacterized membrane protein